MIAVWYVTATIWFALALASIALAQPFADYVLLALLSLVLAEQRRSA